MTPWTISVLCYLLKGCWTDIVILERFAAGKNKKRQEPEFYLCSKA